jgi:hypothetical protein
MIEQGQKEFLVNTMVSLLQRALVYQSLVDWLTHEVGVSQADIEKVLKDIRREMEKEDGLQDKLRTVVESALQSGEANYDLVLASALSQWKPTGRMN